MNIEALIKIKLMSQADPSAVLIAVRNVPLVQWARLAFGPDADIIAFVIGPDQNTVANTAMQINQIPGVASTSTIILATI